MVKLLDGCPSALSVGRLVLENGFNFEWKTGKYPSLYLPDGRRIILKVRKFVPILDATAIATALTSQAPRDSSDTETTVSDDCIYAQDTDCEDEDWCGKAMVSDSEGEADQPDGEDAPPLPPPPLRDHDGDFADYDSIIPEDARHVPDRPPPPLLLWIPLRTLRRNQSVLRRVLGLPMALRQMMFLLL